MSKNTAHSSAPFYVAVIDENGRQEQLETSSVATLESVYCSGYVLSGTALYTVSAVADVACCGGQGSCCRSGSSLGLEVLAGLLGDEDLPGATGNLAGGHPGAVLGANQGQVALGGVGAILGRLQFALEAAHAGQVLLAQTLLRRGSTKVRHFSASFRMRACLKG